MSSFVRITDVSPRDGLQNEPGVISTDEKIRLVESLCETGVDEIEVTSFVSARWVPQLGDAAAVLSGVRTRKPPGMCFSVLVPNDKGMEAALRANDSAGARLIDKVAVFTAASETFAQRNTNASIGETIERFRAVVGAAHANGLVVRGYVSCAIACPFEGPISPVRVAEVVQRLRDLGVDELDLGDTIGAGDAASIRAMLIEVDRVWPVSATDEAVRSGRGLCTLHLHDTFGRAATCVGEALRSGVRSFDGATAGLGGCPYAGTAERPAPGNVDTGLVVRAAERAGYETHVDLTRLEGAAQLARSITSRARALA
ncbi:MAG: hydroxymethylglutaryl-CoA lyase [Phycisphaerae bacterium]|nr:hydroxymethylglutaryl-CoA lyase [Phycisphaerae bacterium]